MKQDTTKNTVFKVGSYYKSHKGTVVRCTGVGAFQDAFSGIVVEIKNSPIRQLNEVDDSWIKSAFVLDKEYQFKRLMTLYEQTKSR